MSDSPLLCDRCVRELTPGRGSFYVVQIEAIADPTPPSFSDDDLRRGSGETMRSLLKELEQLSPREGMDQVHRRLQLNLCLGCYEQWIENPAGP